MSHVKVAFCCTGDLTFSYKCRLLHSFKSATMGTWDFTQEESTVELTYTISALDLTERRDVSLNSGMRKLGRSMQLLIPLTDRRTNETLGEEQQVSHLKKFQRMVRLFHLKWDKLRSENGIVHGIEINVAVTLDNSGVVFSIHIDNRTDLVVENVHWPCLRDLQPANKDAEFVRHHHYYGTTIRRTIWPRFQTFPGYYGTEVPTIAGSDGLYVAILPFLLFYWKQELVDYTWELMTAAQSWSHGTRTFIQPPRSL